MRAKQSPKGRASQQPISGIHHVTAIASDPQRNLDFYTEVLGMRLAKRTVTSMNPSRIISMNPSEAFPNRYWSA
jgi:predicted enzyme related to lactoylglutathione lyase